MTDVDSRPPIVAHHRKKVVWVTVLIVLVVVGGIGLALFQPWRIFTRSTVDEALPIASAARSEAMASPTAEALKAAPEPASSVPSLPATPALASAENPLTGDTPAADTPAGSTPAGSTPAADTPAGGTPAGDAAVPALVAPEPVVLASGAFVDGEHSTSGVASILLLPDGSRFVRLEGFSTSDGPDVDVWLTDQQAGGDDWGKYDDSRYVSLGDLKGTDGNQNYSIPDDAELSGLTSVVIWCDRFNVAFGSAALAL